MDSNTSTTPLSREELKLILIEHLKQYPRTQVANIMGSYPTWGEAISLANYAKEFVATLGTGYLGLHFG